MFYHREQVGQNGFVFVVDDTTKKQAYVTMSKRRVNDGQASSSKRHRPRGPSVSDVIDRHFSPNTNISLENDAKHLIKDLWQVQDIFLPCANPCSILRKNLRQLKDGYVVGPKNDGVRLFALWGCDEKGNAEYAFVIDRTYTFFLFQADFVPAFSRIKRDDVFSGTLLDGELVDLGDGKAEYVVFDAIAVSGFSLTNTPHDERMRRASSVVNHIANFPVPISMKDWRPVSETVDVWERASKTGHSDGVIFVKNTAALENGTNLSLFKLKQEHHIDFILRSSTLAYGRDGVVVDASTLGIQLDTTPSRVLDDAIALSQTSTTPVVVECACAFSHDQVTARPVKLRTDKTTANDEYVVKATLQNILEGLTVHDVVSALAE